MGEFFSFGDKNMAYFHTCTMAHHRRNKIVMLEDNMSKWIFDDEQLSR